MGIIASSEFIEDFLNLDYIYIDKTEFIYNIITNYKKVFLSRPRRFGKSLTLNIIGTLFSKGVNPYFKNTWIYDKWKYPPYPVLKLNFLDFPTDDLDEFKRQICNYIKDIADLWKLDNFISDKEPSVCIQKLLKTLSDDRQVVILIDEYDCQLTANINKPEKYENFRNCIRNFYAVLKGEKHIRFMAVTGVTRLKDVSIFSVGSDITDLTYNHAYAQITGFTEEEIKKYYIDQLKLGISYDRNKDINEVTDDEIDELIRQMACHYDGYCFDKLYTSKVFSTFSVNTFLKSINENKQLVFDNYWYESGGLPAILRNYVQSHDIDINVLLESKINIGYNDFINPSSLVDMNINVLLCQAGYLTLKSQIISNQDVMLGLTNLEIANSLCALISLKLFKENVTPQSLNKEFIMKKAASQKSLTFSTVFFMQYLTTNIR